MVPQAEFGSSPQLAQLWTVSDPDYKERATEMAASTWKAIQTGDGTFLLLDSSRTTFQGLCDGLDNQAIHSFRTVWCVVSYCIFF